MGLMVWLESPKVSGVTMKEIEIFPRRAPGPGWNDSQVD